MRTVVAVLAALSTLALAACGDDDDDDKTLATLAEGDGETAEATVPGEVTAPDVTTPDVSIPDLSIPDFSIPDFSIPDFSIPDFSIPDFSVPGGEEVEEQLREVWESIGLDDEQIDCLLERIDVEGGTTDPGTVFDLLDDCDIDLTDLTGGG